MTTVPAFTQINAMKEHSKETGLPLGLQDLIGDDGLLSSDDDKNDARHARNFRPFNAKGSGTEYGRGQKSRTMRGLGLVSDGEDD